MDEQNNSKIEWEGFISEWKSCSEDELATKWKKCDIADGVNSTYGENSLGQFAKETGETATSLQQYRRVARAYPEPEQRFRNLNWSIYLQASLADSYDKRAGEFTTDNRFKWLDEAEDNQWSVRELKYNMKNRQAELDGDTKFDIVSKITADFCHRITQFKQEELTPGEWHQIVDTMDQTVEQLRSRCV